MGTDYDISRHAWKPWRDLGAAVAGEPLDMSSYECLDYLGVYIFGHFQDRPNEDDENLHLREEVVYIGRAKKIHKRSISPLHEKIDAYKFYTGDWRLACLYVALITVDNCFYNTPATEKWLRGLEKLLTNEHKAKFGRLPPLNKQSGG